MAKKSCLVNSDKIFLDKKFEHEREESDLITQHSNSYLIFIKGIGKRWGQKERKILFPF